MNDTKHILRQRHGLGLTRDRIAAACGVSAGAVSHILKRAPVPGRAGAVQIEGLRVETVSLTDLDVPRRPPVVVLPLSR